MPGTQWGIAKDSSLHAGSLGSTGERKELTTTSIEKQKDCDCSHCTELRRQQKRYGEWHRERHT